MNDEYSILLLNNISAKTYVKNLSFEYLGEQIKTDEGVIDLTFDENEEFPTYDKLLIFYPFENDMAPIFGNTFNDELLNYKNNNLLKEAASYISNVSNNVLELIDLFVTKKFTETRKNYI